MSDRRFCLIQPEWKLTCAFSKKAAAAEGASTLETVATNAVFNEVKAQRMVINGVDVLDKLRELQAKVDRLEAAPSDLAHERPQADLAEWMERLSPQESMVAGDLVECRSQRITKTITGLPGSTLFVVSTDPFLTGHAQPEDKRHLFERVAMLGRVPVRVVGECPNNAFLVPSGGSDGLARAVPTLGGMLEDQALRAQCFGVVWAQLPPDSDSTPRVLAFVSASVGLPAFGELHPSVLERAMLRSGTFTHGVTDAMPRPYQEQCISRSIDANTIVNLPTGTGKTLVATRVIDCYLGRSRQSNDCKRVLFTAPTRALVEQQADRCRRQCFPPIRIINLCSEEVHVSTWERKEWSGCLAHYDVIVGTPAIFVHALTVSGCLPLEAFSLLIFDEVHNATGGSPMASIMCDAYQPMVKRGEACPRVLGLTASFVAGKVTHLELKRPELEVLMQSSLYTPPALEEYMRARREPTYHPVPYEKDTPAAADELVQSKVDALIESFQAIGAPGTIKDCTKTVDHAKHVLEQVGIVGLTYYLSECVAFQLEAKATHLATMRSDDPDSERCRLKAQELLRVLPQLRAMCKHAAETLSHDGLLTSAPNISSKCQALLTLIGDLFTKHRSDDTFRGMIFVKQVALTFPLCHVLNFHLRDLRTQQGLPESVCADAVSGVGSMSDAARNKARDSFANGTCRVLICTEAFLEGIDVPDCAFVVRFSEFDTAKSHIQGAGRARQEAAHIFYFDNSIPDAQAQAKKLAECAQDTSLQLSVEERLERIELRRVAGIYPYTPVGGTAEVTIYNAPDIVQSYFRCVHGHSVDLEGAMSYGRASAQAPMLLLSISYPAPGGVAVIRRDDMLRYWGDVDFPNDIVDPARIRSLSKEDLEKRRFLFVVAVDMHHRRVLGPMNAPVARAVEEARTALGGSSTPSPHVLGSVLLRDVFAPGSQRVGDGSQRVSDDDGSARSGTTTAVAQPGGSGSSVARPPPSAPTSSVTRDFKSELNLKAQANNWSLSFEDEKVAEQSFRSTVTVGGDRSFSGEVAIGKKAAQQSAARRALDSLLQQ